MDRRNEELKSNQSYVVWYYDGITSESKKYYHCFGRTSLQNAIDYHDSKGDEYYVGIAKSESPY